MEAQIIRRMEAEELSDSVIMNWNGLRKVCGNWKNKSFNSAIFLISIPRT